MLCIAALAFGKCFDCGIRVFFACVRRIANSTDGFVSPLALFNRAPIAPRKSLSRPSGGACTLRQALVFFLYLRWPIRQLTTPPLR
jgi:hypothetical protein